MWPTGSTCAATSSFDTRVRAASFDEAAGRWAIATDGGEQIVGPVPGHGDRLPVARPSIPDFPGLDSFEGPTFHTGRWPHDAVDFTGQRVGVIGTGSSAIQSIPVIARQARELVVFQRTATYSVPAHNHPLDAEEQRAVKADYAGFRRRNSQTPRRDRLQSRRASEARRSTAAPERAGPGLRGALGARRPAPSWRPSTTCMLDRAGQRARPPSSSADKIRQIVTDPAVAERLLPPTVIGCKRLCVDTGYYETFNRDNVELVDVSAAPDRGDHAGRGARPAAASTSSTAIVFATGFDAMTGALDQDRHPRPRRASA